VLRYVRALLFWLCALLLKRLQPAVVAATDEAVEAEAVTEKGVTEGDAPEDVGASQARRNTVSIQTYTRTKLAYTLPICTQNMHTDTHILYLYQDSDLAVHHNQACCAKHSVA
jgi:hypothetical protein